LERIRHSLVTARPGMEKVATSAAAIAVAVVVAADAFAGIDVGVAVDAGGADADAAAVAIVVDPKPLPLEPPLLVLTSAAGKNRIHENYLESGAHRKQLGRGTQPAVASSDNLAHPSA